MTRLASRETLAIEIVRSALKIDGSFDTELLFGGCSGAQLIKVNIMDKAYIVRFWNMRWIEYFPQDLACQVIASDSGYGPRVFFVDEAKGITVIEYHPPEVLPETRSRLPLLADLLKKIHTGPLVPKGIDRSIYIDELIEDSSTHSSYLDLQTIAIVKQAVFAVTRPNALCVPCHRDLHPGNLIYTQENFLAIDYTWGAMDDPYADLANIAIFNCVDQNEEHLLLKLYLGREPSSTEAARLSLMKIPAKIFYGLEFLGLASVNTLHNAMQKSTSGIYRNFGRHGVVTSQSDFIEYAISILSEVIDYSYSMQYAHDIALVQEEEIQIGVS